MSLVTISFLSDQDWEIPHKDVKDSNSLVIILGVEANEKNLDVGVGGVWLFQCHCAVTEGTHVPTLIYLKIT